MRRMGATMSERVSTKKQNMNRLNKQMLALALMLGAGESAFATDLLSLYREAQLQDSTYAGAKAQYIGAQEKLPQAKALLLPSVNFTAGSRYNEVNTDYPNNPNIAAGRSVCSARLGVRVTAQCS